MDASQKAAAEAMLADAIRNRDELNVVIRFLSAQLGKPAPSGGGPGGGLNSDASSTPAAPGAPPVTLVGEGEFHGQSAPKATIELLNRVGRTRPLKTGEIYVAIKRGGVQIKNQDGLYRALHRDGRFRKVGVSLWGLEAWYPPRPKGAKDDDHDEPDGQPDDDHGAQLEEVEAS